MQRYVSQPADGENLGKYEVAVWNERQKQYVSNGGPYYLTLEEATEAARKLNEDCKHY